MYELIALDGLVTSIPKRGLSLVIYNYLGLWLEYVRGDVVVNECLSVKVPPLSANWLFNLVLSILLLLLSVLKDNSPILCVCWESLWSKVILLFYLLVKLSFIFSLGLVRTKLSNILP